jgi:hypothetical protein
LIKYDEDKDGVVDYSETGKIYVGFNFFIPGSARILNASKKRIAIE